MSGWLIVFFCFLGRRNELLFSFFLFWRSTGRAAKEKWKVTFAQQQRHKKKQPVFAVLWCGFVSRGIVFEAREIATPPPPHGSNGRADFLQKRGGHTRVQHNESVALGKISSSFFDIGYIGILRGLFLLVDISRRDNFRGRISSVCTLGFVAEETGLGIWNLSEGVCWSLLGIFVGDHAKCLAAFATDLKRAVFCEVSHHFLCIKIVDWWWLCRRKTIGFGARFQPLVEVARFRFFQRSVIGMILIVVFQVWSTYVLRSM